MTRKFTPTASTPLSLLSIDDTLFLPVPVVERLLQKRLSRAITFPGGVVSREDIFASNVFGRGYFLPRNFFHWQLSFCVGDCPRYRHCLIQEDDFAKGAYNLGAVLLG